MARMGENVNVYRGLVGNLKERDCLKGVGVDKMILKWIFFSV